MKIDPGKQPFVIAVANQKGGVAKTSTTLMIGACLAELGNKVLIIDCDAQGNASLSMNRKNEDYNIADIYESSKFNVNDIVFPVLDAVKGEKGEDGKIKVLETEPVHNMWCIPADLSLAEAEIYGHTRIFKESILHKAIKQLDILFDYILIDTGPSLGLTVVNALYAADFILVPAEPCDWSIDAISALLRISVELKDKQNFALLRTRINRSKKISYRDMNEQITHAGYPCLKVDAGQNTEISDGVKAQRIPVIQKPDGKAHQDYQAITSELLTIIGGL